jgi:hypothetical protein
MKFPTFHNSMVGASPQKGGALIYILIAIALLAALTTTFVQPGGQSSRTQNSFQLASTINSQSRVIRSAIQDCILRYPQGNSAITETGYVAPYPLNPNSNDATYAAFDNGDPGTLVVSDLRCPGANYGQLFGGSGQFTTFLSPPPDLMEPWTYFNGGSGAPANAVDVFGLDMDGVYYQIQSDFSDPFIAEAFQKIDDVATGCEVDYAVGDDTNGCETGYQCLRFWIIRGDDTSATPGCP